MRLSKILETVGKTAPAAMFLFAFGGSVPTQAAGHSKPPVCVDTPPYDTTPLKGETICHGRARGQVGGVGLGWFRRDNGVVDWVGRQRPCLGFHVIGITRRGWLPSSQPRTGYDLETRAADDIKVLDALGIKKTVFVGHSIAGSELTKIATRYANYVDKLVYLDASDLSERWTFPDIPPPFSLITQADARSLFTFQAASARLLGVREPIPATCPSYAFHEGGIVTGTSTPDAIPEQLSTGAKGPANPPTNWADIKAPRLGIFAPPTLASKLPFYPYLNPADRAVFDERFPRLVQRYSDVIREFGEEHPGSTKPKVYLLPGAPHYVYINNEASGVTSRRRSPQRIFTCHRSIWTATSASSLSG